MDKPIPAFYACYLLRSTVRHASLYIGSTPNPVRRLRQHNGDAKGGAAKTSRDSLRPWEMTCLVMGFPSKVAALQFEWAWQNTHLTRHLSPNSRLTQTTRTVRFSPKTGRARKRAARPRLSLTDRLANLHQLLQASSFGRWPLRVTFYAKDVFRVWQKWTAHEPKALPSRIEITLDEPSENPNDANNISETATGIYALDVGYKGLKPHLEKSRTLLINSPPCTFCHTSLPADGALSLVCPESGCEAIGHLDCFASSFLDDADSLVPIGGHCPRCNTKLQWVELVKELSLRMRAPKDVEKILKGRRSRVNKTSKLAALVPNSDDETSDEDEDEMQDDPIAEDDWHYISDDMETDIEGVVRSDPSPHLKAPGGYGSMFVTRSEPVIEDSDWDDAEVVI